jgi:hypothetical protein
MVTDSALIAFGRPHFGLSAGAVKTITAGCRAARDSGIAES